MDYEQELSQMIKIIFADCNIDNLSSYEKRERIFSYLTDTVSYDFDLLEKIREKALQHPAIRLFGHMSRNEVLRYEQQATLLVNPREKITYTEE